MAERRIQTIADLQPDPRNARRHTQRNVGMLVDSLQEVGAARSIVVDENGVILAGNATVEAAGEVGIERVRVVDADGETLVAVRRTGLTPEQKARLALLDNRVAELAEWEPEVLATLAADGVRLDDMWNEAELSALEEEGATARAAQTLDAEPGSQERLGKSSHLVRIVLYVDEVRDIERAVAATGMPNRGEAFLRICREWMAAHATG
jgi:ParB-like chromosome segregation protein Spo0J